jgi:hypothetical protein
MIKLQKVPVKMPVDNISLKFPVRISMHLKLINFNLYDKGNKTDLSW